MKNPGCAFLIACLLIVGVIAFGGCDPNAPDGPLITVAPTPTAEPSSPEVSDDALTRYSVNEAWREYTPEEKSELCASLDLLGPEGAAEIFESQDDANLLDPDIAVDELNQLCEE